MSEEQFKAFLEKVKSDPKLQEMLKASNDIEAVVAIAKEAGFTISSDDLSNVQSCELSEDELEALSGGGGTYASLIQSQCKCNISWNC